MPILEKKANYIVITIIIQNVNVTDNLDKKNIIVKCWVNDK